MKSRCLIGSTEDKSFYTGGCLIRPDDPVRRVLHELRKSVHAGACYRKALALPTKKEAEVVVDTVVTALESTLLNNLSTDGFTLKLGSFGKFSVRCRDAERLFHLKRSSTKVTLHDSYDVSRMW